MGIRHTSKSNNDLIANIIPNLETYNL